MSADKRIVTPTNEEVAKFGGQAAEAPAPPPAEGEAAAPTASSEAEEWKNKCLRARADLSNYQKRAEKDRGETVRYAITDMAKSLLPVLDSLDRVIAAGSGAPESQALTDGIKLTRDMLLKALRQFNVSEIEAEGKPFDPSVHEAMMERPSDEHPHHTVLQQLEKGYKLHDRVLRPARVIVSKGKEASGGGDDTNENVAAPDAK